jgi:hypothetical protein
VGVQEVTWDKGGSELADYYTFLCARGNTNHHLGTGFFFFFFFFLYIRKSDQSRGYNFLVMGCWHNSVLNVPASTEDKCDDIKESFYAKVEHMYDQFPKYRITILL